MIVVEIFDGIAILFRIIKNTIMTLLRLQIVVLVGMETCNTEDLIESLRC